MSISDMECEISTLAADARTVGLLAVDVCEHVREPDYYKLHAITIIAEHQEDILNRMNHELLEIRKRIEDIADREE